MIRRTIEQTAMRGERYFRWRGGEVSRLEGLADAVIALAMTLLIVSLQVPEDFGELMQSFRQLPAFAACFALLVMCWYYHYQFHRRFGLENFVTVVLNAALLFLILFYVYPLKFLFTELFGMWLFGERGAGFADGRLLMLFYSSGVVGIFALFGLMNLYAYRHRRQLGLDAVERYMTLSAVREHGIHVLIGVLSIGLALVVHPAFSGLIYFLVGPAQGIHGWLSGRRVERIAAQAT